MTVLTRRAALKAAAWSVPVVAAAVAVPAVTASQDDDVVTCGGSAQDNGTYTVQGNRLTISYRTAPEIYAVNARGNGWQRSYGTNYSTAPARGTRTWEIALLDDPTWIQVHGFNAHFGEVC